MILSYYSRTKDTIILRDLTAEYHKLSRHDLKSSTLLVLDQLSYYVYYILLRPGTSIITNTCNEYVIKHLAKDLSVILVLW